MARLAGGIFSRASGKLADIVIGAARTRQGKVSTARQKVDPSNPNTVAQQTQRNKMKEAIAIVRLIGSAVYQADWNRSVGQLPGFQSLSSIFLNSLDATFNITTIPPINLGTLHAPASVSIGVSTIPGTLKVDWSTELGLNGLATDIVQILAVETAPGATPLERIVKVKTSGTVRSDATFNMSGFGGAIDVSVLLYFKGSGATAGLISPTSFTSGIAA